VCPSTFRTVREVVEPPQLLWNEFIESYEVRRFVLRDRR
jgi:hypothetical protein